MVFHAPRTASDGADTVDVATIWAFSSMHDQKAFRLPASSSPNMSSQRTTGLIACDYFRISNCASFTAMTAERCCPSEANDLASLPPIRILKSSRCGP